MMLLARNVDNFEHMYLKERSAEIFDQQSMLTLFSAHILERTNVQCTLTTLDNIQLTVQVNIQIFCHQDNNAFCMKYGIMPGLFKDSVICMYIPKIEQSHLDLLYKTRKAQKDNF